MQKRHLRSLDLADDQSRGHAQRWSPCRSLGFQVDSCPGRVRNAGRGQPLHTRTVFVNQFTSDCCLGLIIWLGLTRKVISMTTVSRITFLSSKARRGADSKRSLAKTCSAHPHQESSQPYLEGSKGWSLAQ